MSFPNKGFWMQRGAVGENGYNNPKRIEPKRSHQWFMDGTGTELFSNKKQAIDTHYSRPISGSPYTSMCTADFQLLSGEVANHLFGPEPVSTVNFIDRSFPSLNGGSFNVGRRDFQDRHGKASVALSMSHFEDPSRFNIGGIRGVEVNQFGDSGAGLSASTGLFYDRGNNGSLYLGPNNMISTKRTLSVGTFGKPDRSLFPMGHSLKKGEENPIPMGNNYSRSKDNFTLMGQSFDITGGNIISIGQSSERGDGNVRSLSSYNKGYENLMSFGQTSGKTNENFISAGSPYNRGSDNPLRKHLTHDKQDSSVFLKGSTQDRRGSGVLLMGHNIGKGDTNTKSFGAHQEEPKTYASRSIISGYDLVMGSQSTVQASQESRLLPNSARVSLEPSLLVGTQNSVQASQEPSLVIGFQNSAKAPQGPSLAIGSQNPDQASQEPASNL